MVDHDDIGFLRRRNSGKIIALPEMLAARVKAVDASAGKHSLELVIAGGLVRQFVEFDDASTFDSRRRVEVNVGP